MQPVSLGHKRLTLAVSLLALSIGMFSCSKDSGNPVSPGATDGDWITGEIETFDLASGGADISGIVTGAVVTAPGGAGGTLDVTVIESGPALSFDAAQFEATYSGGEALNIQVPRESGEEVLLFAYGPLENAATDGRTGITDWWSVPVSAQTDSSSMFDLPLGQAAVGKIAGAATRQFAIATLPAGSSETATLAAIRQSVREVVDYWLDNLPADIADDAREEITGGLAYTISWSNSGNAYQHGDNWISSNAVFYFTKTVSLSTIAHEVGHYMTHVLCGYDRYEEIYSRFPTDFWGAGIQHGIGDYREGRLDLLEDYAYFSTYMITDALQATDLAKTPMWTFFKNNRPDDVDYPSQEAYGATMLGTLLRSEHEVYSFDKKNPKVSAPAVNAPLRDVLGIIARGPRDVNELREFISEYLTERGTDYQYMLPAILEPMGWSYNGMGMVKFDDGTIVEDASVRAICQTGEGEYRTTISTTTGANGRYLLTRIYPGANILRVYYNSGKDSTDVPFAVEWEHQTHDTLDIPEIVIPKDKPAEATLTGTFAGTDNMAYENGEPVITISGSGGWTVTGTGIEFEDDRDGNVSFICSRGAKGTLTVTGSAELSGNTTESSFFQQRTVYTYHEPVLLGPIIDQNYLFDENAIQTATGGGGSITIEFEFPASDYWGTLQISPQFEVRCDYETYNGKNEVIDSATDIWWMNYSFSHYYFHVSP